jgi:hypothetical protein
MWSFKRRKSWFPLIPIWTKMANGRDLHNYFCLSNSVVHSKIELHGGSISKVHENSHWFPSLHSFVWRLICWLGTGKTSLSCLREKHRKHRKERSYLQKKHISGHYWIFRRMANTFQFYDLQELMNTELIRCKTKVKIINITPMLNLWYKALSKL